MDQILFYFIHKFLLLELAAPLLLLKYLCQEGIKYRTILHFNWKPPFQVLETILVGKGFSIVSVTIINNEVFD